MYTARPLHHHCGYPQVMEFVQFNVLFAHLFAALSRSQATAKMQVNTCKLITVTTIMDCNFPTIKSTKVKPTSMISSRTVSYIHALVVVIVTVHHAESTNASDLSFEKQTWDEMGEDPEVWSSKLRNCLVDWPAADPRFKEINMFFVFECYLKSCCCYLSKLR